MTLAEGLVYNAVMALTNWISHNWFALVQTGATASGLLLTGVAVLLEARARRVGNLIQLTQQHRDLWERMYSQPELARILDPSADLTRGSFRHFHNSAFEQHLLRDAIRFLPKTARASQGHRRLLFPADSTCRL